MDERARARAATFTLYLPPQRPGGCPPSTRSRRAAARADGRQDAAARRRALALPDTLTDDRADLPPGERVALVMTEDRALARGVGGVAHEHGFRCLLALRGDAGLALVHEFMPDAVIVQPDLPQLNGDAVLDHLKRHPETRHLPVYVLADDGAGRELRHAGALGCLTEAATPERLGDVFAELARASSSGARRAVLVVEADERERDGLGDLIGGADVEVVGGRLARARRSPQLDARDFDCVVLDLRARGRQRLRSCSTGSSARSASATCR